MEEGTKLKKPAAAAAATSPAKPIKITLKKDDHKQGHMIPIVSSRF